MSEWIKHWKSWASARWPNPGEQPVWQSNYWDRQLRSEEHYQTRWRYIRNNPVRHGLVARPEEWPFQGEPTRLQFRDR
jgi:REP element-mobilizing transposase RayT